MSIVAQTGVDSCISNGLAETFRNKCRLLKCVLELLLFALGYVENLTF